MKLQLAVDLPDLSAALALADQVVDCVDIVEVGTPLVLREGARAVEAFVRRYPRLEILADFKIMDAGRLEAQIAFDAGARIVTVLGVADDATIAGAVAQAKQCGGRVMADLIAARDVAARTSEVLALGADLVCVHTAFDVQGRNADALHEVRSVAPAAGAALAVAGGIQPASAAALVPYRPAVVVVGGYIANHRSPRAAALAVRTRLNAP